MLKQLVLPEPIIPHQTPVYKLNNSTEKLLSWDFVAERMTQARHYWVTTTAPDGRPHARPLWGIWYENRVHLEGNPNARWLRNLQQNPQVSVHLPEGDKVVIIEGRFQIIEDDEISEETWQIIDSLYQTKYATEHGSPYIVVHPDKVIAWDSEGLDTMTRWIFNA
jgi:general stress protein 26